MSFSVILNCYDTTPVQRHMTITCLATITKFTDEPYEIIVVDNDKTEGDVIRNDYGAIKEFVWLPVPLMNVYESYNFGADAATHDKLMFIQNDVYVHERTLNKLSVYLDEWDVAYPQQHNLTRDQVNSVKVVPDGQLSILGQRDAGLLAITRQAFEKSGGWDERYHNLLGEAAFYSRIDEARLSWTDRTNAFVTHIMAANNLAKDKKLYNKEMDHDAKILNAGRV